MNVSSGKRISLIINIMIVDGTIKMIVNIILFEFNNV